MTEKKEQVKMNKDMQIGFHYGAIQTLVKEREEMMKILQIVESLIQLHFKALKESGFDVSQLQKPKEDNKKKSSMDEMLK